MNILIVDDDKDDALWLSEIITEMIPACSFHFESDGIAALRHIKNNIAPGIVFLDLNMPLKNGLECLKDIHNHELLPLTPIIIYSTSNNIKDIDQSYKYGAVYYIVKPTFAKQLKSFVKQALSYLYKPVSERAGKEDFVLRADLSSSEGSFSM